MNLSDIMIHVNEPLSVDAQHVLEDRVRAIDGVVSSHFNPGRKQLMMVAYDPDVARSTVLLAKVREAGFTAQMVGL